MTLNPVASWVLSFKLASGCQLLYGYRSTACSPPTKSTSLGSPRRARRCSHPSRGRSSGRQGWLACACGAVRRVPGTKGYPMCDVCRTCAYVSKIFYYHPKSVASQNVVSASKSSQSVGHACGRFIFLVPLEPGPNSLGSGSPTSNF